MANFDNWIMTHLKENVKDCTVSFPTINQYPYWLPQEIWISHLKFDLLLAEIRIEDLLNTK